jgi:SDR family mycofactocin-dependent oxidoreductase
VAGRVEGKVALVTGAARGQGRSHAVRLAEEGADLILVDAPGPGAYSTITYETGTEAELRETASMVENLGRRAILGMVDVRDRSGVQQTVDAGVAELGRLDIAVANAGVCRVEAWSEVTVESWREIVDTNMTGVWNTIAAAAGHMTAAGAGSIICISSTAGVKGVPFLVHYAASKHAVVGMAKTMALELAQHSVRVNVIHPTGVETGMSSPAGRFEELIAGNPGLGPVFVNTLPVTHIEAVDVSNAVLYLASDEARYVTGLELAVDAGNTIR